MLVCFHEKLTNVPRVVENSTNFYRLLWTDKKTQENNLKLKQKTCSFWQKLNKIRFTYKNQVQKSLLHMIGKVKLLLVSKRYSLRPKINNKQGLV